MKDEKDLSYVNRIRRNYIFLVIFSLDCVLHRNDSSNKVRNSSQNSSMQQPEVTASC